jgi:hypothetical protein
VAAAKSVANMASSGFGKAGSFRMVLTVSPGESARAKTQAKLKLKPWLPMPSRSDAMAELMA